MDERASTIPIIPPIHFASTVTFSRDCQCVTLKYYLCCHIRLSQGKFAIIDPVDWLKLVVRFWFAKKGWGGYYAYCKKTIDGQTTYTHMHRLIAKTPPELHCHHKNGRTLDNRRANLENWTPGYHENYHRMLRIARKSA